jgi:hypothetical protein
MFEFLPNSIIKLFKLLKPLASDAKTTTFIFIYFIIKKLGHAFPKPPSFSILVMW